MSEGIWGTYEWLMEQVGKGAQAAQEAAKTFRQEL